MVTKSFFTTDLRHPYNKAGDGPEGPEVRTTRDKLAAKITGSYLVNYQTDGQIKGDDQLIRQCQMLFLTDIGVHGKKILFNFVSPQGERLTLIVSLGMTGRFYFYDTIAYPNTHAFLTFVKDQQTMIVGYQDPRKIGSFKSICSDDLATFLSDLGPDLLQAALTTEITDSQWLKIFAKPMRSSSAIVKILTDQKYVAGIGWYLAMEILYFSGISPHRPSNEITLDEWLLLRRVAHHIIKVSYQYGGFTIKDFISPDGQNGCYPAAVYGKKVDSHGYPVINDKCSGRTTHYVKELQR